MTEKQSLTLPASLERLEIDPTRASESISTPQEKASNPFLEVKSGWEMDCLNPESVLESLSLSGAECPSGTCHCNKRRLQGQGASNVLHRTTLKKPILQRSRLSSQLPTHKVILKEPILRLSKTTSGVNLEVDSTSKESSVSTKTNAQAAEDLALHVGAAILEQKKKKVSCLVQKGKQRRTKEVRFKCPDDLEECATEFPGKETQERSTTGKQTANTSPCSLQARLTDTYVESSGGSHSQPLQSTTDDTTIDELASYFDLFVHIPKKMSHMAEMMYI